jgi:hypothetical protein
MPPRCRFGTEIPRAVLPLLLCAPLFAAPAMALPPVEFAGLELTPTFQTLIGLQHGDNVNYGLGALDSIGETERNTLYVAFKPKVDALYDTETWSAYGAASFVAATTTLDGEISGQVARSGDQAFDTDHLYLGWRNELFDLSVGGQEFSVGDGFIIGDGNYNKGGENGQYWTGAFLAWRNSAILKINTEPVRADIFWLRTDKDFKDSRVVGINIETTTRDTFGTIGVMYLEVLQGGAFNLDGINAWNVRGANIKVPGVPNLELFGEWVLELGTDKQAGGRDNNAIGWYLEGQYTFVDLPWTPRVSYRYARMSGDELDTEDNEEYRGLYFTIFRRDWDTWYQGEIAGEYHLYNQNQITQMFKVKTFPRPAWAITFYYYHHELEEPQYFGTPVTSSNWADEINFGFEHFRGQSFYGYAGIAWSTPNAAAKQIYGDKNFAVLQTWLSFVF